MLIKIVFLKLSVLKCNWLDLHMGPLRGLGNFDVQYRPAFQMEPNSNSCYLSEKKWIT